MQIKFSLVDDNAEVLRVLRTGIQSAADFTCVGCYASGAEALAGIPRTPGDVVLMDIRMPGMTGIECTHRLHTVLPQLPILMLTGCADHATICRALMVGAAGYLTKPAKPCACAKAMRDVIQGGAPLCREAALAVVSAFRGAHALAPGDGLSLRERELMACLFRGQSDKEIASKLGIGLATVHTHLHRLFAKLKVKNRADAVSKYLSGAAVS